MKHRFATAIAIAAVASFGLVACGDDEEDEPATTAETTTEETTDDGATGGGGGAEATLEFTADPDGELAYLEDSAETTAGSNEVTLVNESQLPHDVRFEDSSGEDIGGTEVITNDETSTTVEFESGDYTFYCSVPGHREAGMEGPLTVE